MSLITPFLPLVAGCGLVLAMLLGCCTAYAEDQTAVTAQPQESPTEALADFVDSHQLRNLHQVGFQLADLDQGGLLIRTSMLLDAEQTELVPVDLTRLQPFRLLIRRLFIHTRPIAPGSLDQLRTMTQLEWLEIYDQGQVDDQTLDLLLHLERLRFLSLVHAHLSDAGLLRLAQLRTLRRLNVWCPQLTPAGLDAFQAARPEVALQASPLGLGMRMNLEDSRQEDEPPRRRSNWRSGFNLSPRPTATDGAPAQPAK